MNKQTKEKNILKNQQNNTKDHNMCMKQFSVINNMLFDGERPRPSKPNTNDVCDERASER